MRQRLGIIAFFCLLGVSYAATNIVVPRSAESIPLPRQSHYLKQGLQAGMGLGNLSRSGCQSRFQWQGGAEYSYAKNLSGGAAVRLFGGAVDEETSLTYSRYFIHSRVHYQPHPTLSVYAGPFFGFDNTSIQSMRDSWERRDEEEPEVPVESSGSGQCEDAFDVNGPGLGWDLGLGWLMHPLFGFTASNTAEANFQKKVRISFSGGLAFNIYAVSTRLQRYVTAGWIHLDWIKAFTVHSGGSENSFLLGFSFGF